MDNEELTKREAAALHLPPYSPIDQDEIVWYRLPDPATDYQDEQAA